MRWTTAARRVGSAVALVVAAALAGTAVRAGGQEGSSQRAADLVLVGTILRESGAAVAIIEDKRTKKQAVYRLGAAVGGGRIAQILPDRVVIGFGDDQVVELRLATTPQTGPVAPPPAGRPVPGVVTTPAPTPPSPHVETPGFRRVGRQTLERLASAPELVTQVTPVENKGVRVGEVLPAGLLETLGVRSGDIILNVNGRVPSATLPLSSIVTQAAGETPVLRVELERGGAMDVVYIQIEP